MMHTINVYHGVCSIHKLSKIQPQPAYYLLQTQPVYEQLSNSFTKTFISKMAS